MNRRDFLKWGLVAAAGISVWAAGDRPWLKVPARRTATSCPPVEERALTLMATGDIMAHLPVTQSALLAGGGYDFRPHFKYVRPMLMNADLVIGNLETPLAGGRPSGYPGFNGPDELAAALKWAGFNALTLANNHSLDQGWAGLQRTAEVVRDEGLMYVGAYLSAADRAAPRLFKAAGVTVGLGGYTYGVNGPRKFPANENWRLNFMDESLMLADLDNLKKAAADFVVYNIHFGDEYQRRPNKKQIAVVEALFEGGADLIIGHHPHVVQPPVMRHKGPDGAGAAIYSLGNFISNQRDRYTDQGLMITCRLGLDHKGGKIFGPLTLHQTRCVKRIVDGRMTYRVLPVYEATQNPEAYGLNAREAAFLSADHQSMSRHLVDYQG
ncbi:CapA family protein [Deltaproteobacteria bacterium OttesenSCG-928-K17]|nr:CapA family protein [Deltaproteobacteria bacterium OttesenSCG-928-K17]